MYDNFQRWFKLSSRNYLYFEYIILINKKFIFYFTKKKYFFIVQKKNSIDEVETT